MIRSGTARQVNQRMVGISYAKWRYMRTPAVRVYLHKTYFTLTYRQSGNININVEDWDGVFLKELDKVSAN